MLLAVLDVVLANGDLNSAAALEADGEGNFRSALPLHGALVVDIIPRAMTLLAITRMVFYAAAVTDKCARVPALINSLRLEKEEWEMQQHLVDYIIHSDAGFYVYGVRLTIALVLKLCYFSCVVVFGLGTKIVAKA